MGFLRRLLGSERQNDAGQASAPVAEDLEDIGAHDEGASPEDIDADERQRELELLRGEQERLDELAQRQLRYAEYAWQPAAQGGKRRADDRDEGGG